MHVQHISLNHFRNFANVDEIIFPPQATLVAAAPNATGKTNFLEALVLMLRGRSWRAGLAECVQWGAESLTVRGSVVSRAGEEQLGVHYHVPSKKLRIEAGGVPASVVTWYSRFPVVLFLPEDTFLLVRGPEGRRNFLNQTLVSLPPYLAALVQYQRALKQRNAALKGAKDTGVVAAWTELLVEYGRVLWHHRESFRAYLATHLAETYQALSGEENVFTVRLQTGHVTPDRFADILTESFASEQRYGYTLHGPHRDDLEISVSGRPVAGVFSRGQLRSLTITLKILAHRYLNHTLQEEPLLLLDEVLSELDASRQQTLLTHLPQTQLLLTCTAVPEVLKKRSDVHLLDLRKIAATDSTQSLAVPVTTNSSEIALERVNTHTAPQVV